MSDLYQNALAIALAREPKDASIAGEPMMAAIAHASRVTRLEAEIERLGAERDTLFSENGKLANELGAECLQLRTALKPFALRPGAVSLSKALGHITREDLIRAADEVLKVFSPLPENEAAALREVMDDDNQQQAREKS